MVKILVWNIAQRQEAWRLLAASEADIALLQEAKAPPADIAAEIEIDPVAWETGPGRLWRTAVVRLTDRVQVEWLEAKPLAEAIGGELGVSRPGTFAAALVTPQSGELSLPCRFMGRGKSRTALPRPTSFTRMRRCIG